MRNDDRNPSSPPAQARGTLGSNQLGMREFNERVVLQAIRLRGATPKADLARITQLSTQTVSVIINRLLGDGLVRKEEALRGRMGQPSQPIALDPDGAFSIGVRIGRRKLEVLLMDFLGRQRYRSSTGYPTADVNAVFAEIAVQLHAIDQLLGPDKVKRLAGVGIAAPLAFGGWPQLLRMPAHDAEAWSRTDIRARLQAMTPLPVEFAKDTAAACVAELVAGRGRTLGSYLYIFVDTLVGGGIVIDSQPHGGAHGNAGAVGSMSLGLPGLRGHAGQPGQVLDRASLVRLEELYAEAELEDVTDARALQHPWLPVTGRWLEGAAAVLALAIHHSACVLDLEGVIVDGAMERPLLARLLEDIGAALGRHNWQGVLRPEVHAGSVGAEAKVSGAAWLPLHAGFAPAHDLFLKLRS
jgi:predicted NBD/HSP70 family sugar kinase